MDLFSRGELLFVLGLIITISLGLKFYASKMAYLSADIKLAKFLSSCMIMLALLIMGINFSNYFLLLMVLYLVCFIKNSFFLYIEVKDFFNKTDLF